jgi:hypothetical protein
MKVELLLKAQQNRRILELEYVPNNPNLRNWVHIWLMSFFVSWECQTTFANIKLKFFSIVWIQILT